MVKSILLIVVALFISQYSGLFGQSKQSYINTASIKYENSLTVNDFDYEILGQSIAGSGASIIGLGEATHGTSEFYIAKANIVKNLVEKHGFKNFLLEAGYVECVMLDSFINNVDMDIDFTMISLLPWPWASQELKELLYWMRAYNLAHPADEKIHFYGVDICSESSLSKSKSAYYGKEHSLPIVNKAIDIYNNTELTAKKRQKKLAALQKECDKTYSNKTHEYFVAKNIIQTAIARLYKGGKIRAYREDLLFETVKAFKSLKPATEKFIIWAHSEHISQHSNNRKSLGFFLNKEYKNQYQTVGFDFVRGSFIAVDIDSLYFGKAKFGREFYREAPKETLAHQLENINTGVLYINLTLTENKKALCRKKRYIQSVGATYGNVLVQKKPKIALQKLNICKSFNYIFIVKTTTASHLLAKQKR